MRKGGAVNCVPGKSIFWKAVHLVIENIGHHLLLSQDDTK